MADFNEALETASNTILKRDLSDDERVEFLELGATLGMESVKDYLYMLMIFKRNEDRLNTRFDEMGALEKKIHDTLESSITKILDEGACNIGRDMGNSISKEAKKVLGANEKFHFLRGQAWMICLMTFLMTVTYCLGTANFFRPDGDFTFLKIVLSLPVGGVALVCVSAFSLMWAWDRWEWVKEYPSYKAALVLQVLVLLAILRYLF
ncbi:hypothetical protein FACS1894216_05180 [Synergistales bacterium]|nr:hypothetical protein FACS1894216_05180 [Synergistales bacterium]